MLPTLWHRNQWSFEGHNPPFQIEIVEKEKLKTQNPTLGINYLIFFLLGLCFIFLYLFLHFSVSQYLFSLIFLGNFFFECESFYADSELNSNLQAPPKWLFTENNTNRIRLHNTPNKSKYVKDAFHEYVSTLFFLFFTFLFFLILLFFIFSFLFFTVFFS